MKDDDALPGVAPRQTQQQRQRASRTMPHAQLQNPHHHNMVISRRARIAAAMMALIALGVAAIGSFTGYRVMRVETPPIIAERTLTFQEFEDGRVTVRNAADGALVATLAEEESGFVRNVLRGFSHTRRMRAVDASEPYRILRFDQRRMAMIDVATGQRYSLHGHGQRTMAAFQALTPMPHTADAAKQ